MTAGGSIATGSSSSATSCRPTSSRRLSAQVRALRAPAREMVEGDTITRHIALDPGVLDRVPAARAPARLTGIPQPDQLCRIVVGDADGLPADDPQRRPCRAARSADRSPYGHIPPHRQGLALSDRCRGGRDAVRLRAGIAHSDPAAPRVGAADGDRGQRRAAARPAQAGARDRARHLAALGLPPPQAIAVPANTLVVADTFGFHARGPSARPTTRVEIWAMGRRNPFLPWAGFDPWALPAFGLRKPLFYWRSVDLLARLGLGRQRWRPCGSVSAFDRA